MEEPVKDDQPTKCGERHSGVFRQHSETGLQFIPESGRQLALEVDPGSQSFELPDHCARPVPAAVSRRTCAGESAAIGEPRVCSRVRNSQTSGIGPNQKPVGAKMLRWFAAAPVVTGRAALSPNRRCRVPRRRLRPPIFESRRPAATRRNSVRRLYRHRQTGRGVPANRRPAYQRLLRPEVEWRLL